MNFSLKKLTAYCEQHTTPVDSVLEELERETHLKTLAPQMMTGGYQGKLLEMISYMLQARYILEIGTFTSYGTLCMARGLHKEGKILSIESNYELETIIRKYIEKAQLKDKVELFIGNAKEIIPKLDYEFDLVYIDAGKQDYPYYFDLVVNKIRQNGFIIVDNVLWYGKVVMDRLDSETKIIDDFNKKVAADPRVENIILPIRDGITIIRKI
jgi:predicted O-methyltransferase YrrM